MSSYISHFKWLIVVVIGFIVTELTIAWLWPAPEVLRNNFLEYGFAETEMLQRAFVSAKMRQFDNLKPEVLQVGDSSGLHGVQSPVIESYIGRRYLNMSIATNLGYWGYYAIAAHVMKRSRSVKVLVLYFSPAGAFPRKELIDADDLMAGDLERAFSNPVRALFHIPSLGVRRQVTDFVYYVDGVFNAKNRPLIENPGYLMLHDIIGASDGWARETDDPGDVIPADLVDGIRRAMPWMARYNDHIILESLRKSWHRSGVEYAWDWRTMSEQSYAEIIFDQYLRLAKRYGAKLIIITNPLPDSFKKPDFQALFDVAGMRAELTRYAKAHPEVSVLNIPYRPDSHFSVFSHIGTPYSIENSIRVGKYLQSVIGDKKGPIEQTSIGEVTDIDMGANPTVYSFGDKEVENGHTFRRIRQGRDEALAFGRILTKGAVNVEVKVLNKPDDPVLSDLTLSAFGVPATRLKAEPTEDGTDIEFRLPASVVQRYGGWLELILSSRGESKWVSNALLPDANGPKLKLERIMLEPAGPEEGASLN
jgi:hypothetical protein